MSWINAEKKRLAFASVERISYAMVTEIWVRKDADLSPEAVALIRSLFSEHPFETTD